MRPILRRGASGHEVVQLQERLAAAGFPPGPIDGRFGAATEAALVAFQRAHELLADGVCGPVTWAMLIEGRPGRPVSVLGRIDLEFVAQLFPFTSLDSLARNLPHVLAGLEAEGLVDKPMVLVALATVRAESEGFEPIEEAISRFNTSPGGRPFDLYDHRADLGNEGPPDGERFKGRGFVQLTGEVGTGKTTIVRTLLERESIDGAEVKAILERGPARAKAEPSAAQTEPAAVSASEETQEVLRPEARGIAPGLIDGEHPQPA